MLCPFVLFCPVLSTFPVHHPSISAVNPAQYGAHWDDLDLDENPAGLGGGSVRVATVMLYLSGVLAAANNNASASLVSFSRHHCLLCCSTCAPALKVLRTCSQNLGSWLGLSALAGL
jgi:hypothetical protein